jgi:hypothetical protein
MMETAKLSVFLFAPQYGNWPKDSAVISCSHERDNLFYTIDSVNYFKADDPANHSGCNSSGSAAQAPALVGCKNDLIVKGAAAHNRNFHSPAWTSIRSMLPSESAINNNNALSQRWNGGVLELAYRSVNARLLLS